MTTADFSRQLTVTAPPEQTWTVLTDVDRLAGWVGQLPLDVALAGDERALIPAAHRDDDIGLLSQLRCEELRSAIAEFDVQFSHHFHNLGVDVLGRGRPCREHAMVAGGVAFEQCLAHLGASGVLPADKQDGGHA